MKPGGKIVGCKALTQKLKKHPQLIQRSVESVLKQEARALAVAYAEVRSPGNQDGVKGAKRINRDVRRVFASRQSGGAIYRMLKDRAPEYAAAYWRMWKSNNTRGMAAVLRKANLPSGIDAGAYKRARTGKLGNVPKNQKPVAIGTEQQIAAMVKRQQQLVGLASAGWYAAGLSLGGRIRTGDVGPNVKKLARRFPGLGGSRWKGGAVAEVTIFTGVKHARAAMSGAEYRRATHIARGKFSKALAQSMAAVNRKQFKGQRAA